MFNTNFVLTMQDYISVSLHNYVRNISFILSKCWFSIGIVVVNYYIFMVNNQGCDIIAAYNEERSITHSVITTLFVLLLGIENWYGARLALNLSNKPIFYNSNVIKYTIIVPRILGYLSMGVFYISFIKYNTSKWLFDYIVLFIPLILFWFIIVKRRKQISKWNCLPVAVKYNLQISISNIKYESLKFSEVTRTGKLFFFLPIILLPVFIILISIYPVAFPLYCTPSIIILSGLAIWTGIVTALGVFDEVFRIPLLLIVVSSLLLFSYFNNNHTIRKTNSELKLTKVSESLNNWYIQADTVIDKPKTMYIICGAGGGIRAAYWTASVLASLTDSVPEFSNHIFAMSTVSGSSLGASLYNSLLKNTHKGEYLSDKVRDYMKTDFLSPIAGAFFFSDAFQRFLPFPVQHFDRSRYLEWAWENGWNNNFNEVDNPFTNSMTDLWTDNKYIPNLLFNCTHTESGRRVIASNLTWDVSNWKSDNILQTIGSDVPLSSAVLLSARFPVLTPGAKLVDKNNNYRGTIVDGGYYDNYGVITASDLYNDIRSKFDSTKVKVVILMIQNGAEIPENPKPLKFAFEIRTVPQTFINAWDIRPEKSLEMLGEKLKTYGDTVITISLKRNIDDKLPLGWYLSHRAINIIDTQLKGDEWNKQKLEILKFI